MAAPVGSPLRNAILDHLRASGPQTCNEIVDATRQAGVSVIYSQAYAALTGLQRLQLVDSVSTYGGGHEAGRLWFLAPPLPKARKEPADA